MTWKIKNWHEFQHYTQRDPPWIRLYRRILNDREWHLLSGDDAKTLVMLWLVASEKEGMLPNSQDIAFKLRMKEKDVPFVLERLSHWVEHDASAMLADCKQDAIQTEKT